MGSMLIEGGGDARRNVAGQRRTSKAVGQPDHPEVINQRYQQSRRQRMEGVVAPGFSRKIADPQTLPGFSTFDEIAIRKMRTASLIQARDRPGRPGLALDLMEELRAPLADRLALSLVNRRQLRASDFRQMEGGAVLLSDEARKLVLTAWQERKKEERLHPFLQEKAPFGLVPYLQAQMLARHLRGDLDAYPPWFWS